MDAPIDVTQIRIETPRLILRPWHERDLEDLYEYASVPGVGEMAGWPRHETMDTSRLILKLFIQEKKTFALELKASGKVIGSLGLEPLNSSPGEKGQQGREVGYALSKDYWGRGLMPEAVQAVTAYCFTVLHYDFLTGGHFIQNNQSRRVVEKCGFQYLKNYTYQTQCGTLETGCLYILYNPDK